MRRRVSAADGADGGRAHLAQAKDMRDAPEADYRHSVYALFYGWDPWWAAGASLLNADNFPAMADTLLLTRR